MGINNEDTALPFERSHDMSTAHLTSERTTSPEQPAGPTFLSTLWWISITATTLAALLLKLLLAVKTYGTNDVYRYEAFMAASRYLGVLIYRALPDFNHPPSMIHFLGIIGRLSRMSGLPFPFWLRLPGILADAGSVLVVWKILGPRVQELSIRWSLLLFAAAPPLIVISGFHGNTDSVMIFFLLLSVYWNEKGNHIWLAGAMFGLSMCFKITPVIVAPAMYFYLRDMKQRVAFFGAAGGILLVAWSPYLFQDPIFILRQIFGYRSLYGHWGLSYFSSRLANRFPALGWVNDAFQFAGSYALLGGIAIFSWWMNRRKPRPRLYSQVGIVFLLFLSLTNGFGVQYLAWLVPWVVGLGALPAAIYFAASGVFLFLVYNYWSQGIPWYMADSYRLPDYQGHLDYYQIASWLSILVALTAALEQLRASDFLPGALHKRFQNRTFHVCTLLAALVLLIYPAQRQARRDNRNIPWATRQSLALIVRSVQYTDLSNRLYRMGRDRDAVDAAQQASDLHPDSADAYLNLAASCAAVGKWDEAIQYSEEAVRLRPDWPLAKSNLDWTIREKKKASK